MTEFNPQHIANILADLDDSLTRELDKLNEQNKPKPEKETQDKWLADIDRQIAESKANVKRLNEIYGDK